jgi:N-acetyl-1-D-myo-inositol-2-amino-2-deoxy-alpha-D-glucopyranoside deacetylase
LNKGATGAARGIAAAVPVALFAALTGTALHRQALLIAGVDVYWGAPAALLLLASLELWLGAWSRSLLPTAVAGIVCYAAVGALSSAGTGKQLIVADVPGNVWVYGSAGVTLVMLLWCRRYRRRAVG